MKTMIDSLYNPKAVEGKIYQQWENSGFFNPDKLPGRRQKKFIVYMPLPNVTGSLHMGHSLDNTISDILIRYYRMKGYKALWFPGTDHAGIATQYVVEKELKKKGLGRFDLGREKFIEKVWKWKREYGNIILEQLKKLGCSADWSRTRFTMDPAYSKDVINAFIHYYKKGWLYQGFRTINWCPRCQTSLSDLEVEYKEEKGKLWYIKYPLVKNLTLRQRSRLMVSRVEPSKFNPSTDEQNYIVVATTRPETMLGDTAIAVNPRDSRYTSFIGKKVLLPIQNREIPIIVDKAIDPKFGTGAVKVTPAHDTADFEIAQRHKLPLAQVIDESGKMNDKAGKYAGLKVEEARMAIIQELKNLGLLVKEEPYEHRLATCYRCGHTIEPIPSKQWFLKMDELAKRAEVAVKTKKVEITPKRFKKSYFNWLKNIRDWTVSRQIWWGHRLPVFYCSKRQEGISNSQFLISKQIQNSSAGPFVVSAKKPKKCPFCGTCEMKQSQDVLDTWFSSALWPFAGLSQKDRKKYCPGNLVSNAREILNLWDARMIFSGLEFLKKVPFQVLLIHGTILTKEGKRMSKSLGTGINPLEYIEKYGADAIRFAVIWQSSGQDIHWDETAVIAGRKFGNKIWNASRFVLAQIRNRPPGLTAASTKVKVSRKAKNIKPFTPADKAVLRALKDVKTKTEKYILAFEFSQALRLVYNFFWHTFCDKYLEISKKQIQGEEKLKTNTQKILIYTLLESLKMLHSFMPFISEAVYQNLPKPFRKEKFLLVEKW
ncbi:valine--tRNA ligase [Candidatus Jorgensenbacteria bacterium CG_4_8_14_3_um_filter_38_10]|nr:MAG: valine--tRNA ligase [Candidatus Jorgensenbacteria bacterium CG_4_8_14_3_um_filter_38_10]